MRRWFGRVRSVSNPELPELVILDARAGQASIAGLIRALTLMGHKGFDEGSEETGMIILRSIHGVSWINRAAPITAMRGGVCVDDSVGSALASLKVLLEAFM